MAQLDELEATPELSRPSRCAGGRASWSSIGPGRMRGGSTGALVEAELIARRGMPVQITRPGPAALAGGAGAAPRRPGGRRPGRPDALVDGIY